MPLPKNFNFDGSSSMMKKPSPRSVIAPITTQSTQSTQSLTTYNTKSQSNHCSFEDEPFDCASECRSRQTTDVHSCAGSTNGGDLGKTKSTNTSPPHSHRSSMPPQSPRRFTVPKSPSVDKNKPNPSTKQKASSFRLRRMQLAQQRKWKEEYIERAIQSKSKMTKASDDENSFDSSFHQSRQRGVIGKELLIENQHGYELSISGHLQKTGFDSSLLPSAERNTYANPYFSHNGNRDGYESADACPDDRSIALDTVSSLNSSHYYGSDDGTGTNKGLMNRSFGRDRKTSKERRVTQEKLGGDHNNVSNSYYEDSLHPPLYVSSITKIRRKKKPTSYDIDLDDSLPLTIKPKKTQKEKEHDYTQSDEDVKNSGDETFNDDLIERKLLANMPESASKNISVMSPFNTSTSSLNKSPNNPLDKTELVSNKAKVMNEQKTIDEKENDIPWHKPYKSIKSRKLRDVSRERPIKPLMLHNLEKTSYSPDDQPSSLSNVKSPTVLRRRRLQLYLFTGDEEKNNNETLTKSKTLDATEAETWDEEIHEIPSPSREKIDSSFYKDDDLSRNETLSVRSGRSARSARSVQTYATIGTCISCQPSSAEELEKVLKLKQRKIYLIHHALTCTHPHATDPDDETYIPCPEVRYCQALCTLVKHVQTCTFVDSGNGYYCPVPGCRQYKKMWNHYRRCILRTFTGKYSKKCRFCGDLWGKREQVPDEGSI